MLEHARRRYTCLAATVECVTDSVSGEGNAIGRVRPSVRLLPLYFLNQLTFDLDFLQVYGSWP